jgi:hypothetical protein
LNFYSYFNYMWFSNCKFILNVYKAIYLIDIDLYNISTFAVSNNRKSEKGKILNAVCFTNMAVYICYINLNKKEQQVHGMKFLKIIIPAFIWRTIRICASLLQVLCYGLSLPLSENETIKDCVNVYCEWLSALTSPKLSVPKPVTEDPNPYAQDMLHHLLNLFVPRSGSGMLSWWFWLSEIIFKS